MNGERKVRNEWLERSGDLLWMSFAVAAATLLLSGCGGEKRSARGAAQASPPVAETVVPAVETGSPAPAMNAALSQGSTANVGDATNLPPEIALGEMDTHVRPGQPLNITVYGTPDVTEISLFDGLNDRQALVHDTGSDTWSVDYRVPLRSKSDRIGLSLTAKNAENRWRRVWVFLEVGSNGQAESTVPATEPGVADSITTK
jgi:hypothetical protein